MSLLVALLCCISAGAQNKAIVVSVDNTYPNARPQWSKAQCNEWLEKYGPIIGVNHPTGPYPSMARRDYLRKAHELGFNSVRFWIGGNTASEYINNVKSFASDCAAYGMTLSPVVSYANNMFYQYQQGNYTYNQALSAVLTYFRELVQGTRGDDRIILWDIWNEPYFGPTDSTVVQQMAWIKEIVKVMRQEGCTQPISCSIIWDNNPSELNSAAGEVKQNARKEAEAMMDIHNFHDYYVEQDKETQVAYVVNRMKQISDRPMVCTECLARVNGSTIPRTLTQFAKYNIGFYSWGLYVNDSNWQVKWGRSWYYAWEPLFHDMLYADGDPYNPAELPWIKDYKFTDGVSNDPGMAYTERWTQRRAWKWLNRQPTRGIYYDSFDEAVAGVAQHATDGLYNSLNVRLKISDYSSNSTTFKNKFRSFLSAADAAGMSVVPTLLSGSDISTYSAPILRNYIYDLIDAFYNDRRILGWNLYQQTTAGVESTMLSKFIPTMNYVRNTFPNQPMFITPLVTSSTLPDSTARDAVNQLWQLSDVVSYNTADGSAPGSAFIYRLASAYDRPIFAPQTSNVPNYFKTRHVVWYTTADQNTSTIRDFTYTPWHTSVGDSGRWEGWKAWQWMNRGETKGRYYSSLSAALKAVDALGTAGLYNSMSVTLDYTAYTKDSKTFFLQFDTLLTKAAQYNLTVLPALLTDKNGSVANTTLADYVADVVGRYGQNNNIIAWDLYYRPGATYNNNSKLRQLMPLLFEAARGVKHNQPLTSTVAAAVQNLGSNPIAYTTHGTSISGTHGWSSFLYVNGNSELLTYEIWCLSDVISFMNLQKAMQLGMLEGVAYGFGRPIFCTRWKAVSAEDPGQGAAFFKNMHTNWYADGTLADTLVQNFKFIPVKTDH